MEAWGKSFNPFMPLTSPKLSASLSTGSTSHSGEGRRSTRRKDFQYNYGQKQHSYDTEKAPYPLAYDRTVLDIEGLDNRMSQHLKGSISLVPFKENHPTRVLDLGCGLGNWVIDAAKAWPECEFVGFDLVDIQIPRHVLPPSISTRIEWRHGNFVTNKLPFSEDEFDHVHIQSIATGVPENKWDSIFAEICRILAPGGSIEVIEDDIIFPILPKWFTQALRPRILRSPSTHQSNTRPKLPTISDQSSASKNTVLPTHDHALLESLYTSMYESRFINMKPSSVLPIYLTTYFRQVALGPIVSFPMPPLPPVQPLPPQMPTSFITPSLISGPSEDLLSPRASTIVPNNGNRAPSFSFSSAISTATSSTFNSKVSSGSLHGSQTTYVPFSNDADTSLSSVDSVEKGGYATDVDITTLPLKHRYMVDNSHTEDNTCMPPGSLFPVVQVNKLNDRSLAMHLYRTYQLVLACQEAMWEELKDRLRNRRDELLIFGWDDDEELEELQSRKKFEKLIERFRTDMEARVSLWYSLNDMGWPLPSREPLSKAEYIEAERLRNSMIEARKNATLEEMEQPCRSVRAIVGYNL